MKYKKRHFKEIVCAIQYIIIRTLVIISAKKQALRKWSEELDIYNTNKNCSASIKLHNACCTKKLLTVLMDQMSLFLNFREIYDCID